MSTNYYSMIFKTFDSDSDKFISKIGILNRSFEQWGESIRARKIDIHELMSAGLVSSEKEAKNQVGSLWSYLYGNKSVKQTPIDLSSFDNFDANDTLSKLQNLETQVAKGSITWQDYFSNLKDGQKWQVEFVQNNDLSKVSLEQVEKAQNSARESAIAYNNGLKQMTLGAKAANVAMKALSIAGNMIVYALIAKGIELAVTAIDNYIHRVEKANEKIQESRDSYNQTTSDLESVNSELETTAQRIDEINSKGKLELTDKEDLEKLQAQTRELQLQQSILEKQKQSDATELVSRIRSKNDTLTDDFDTDLLAYTEKSKYVEGYKEEGLRAIEEGITTYEQYQEDIAREEDSLNQYYSDVLDNIANFEENRQSILDKYNGDTSSMSISDKELYDSITESLNEAYKAVYSDSEYNKFVIEPIFSDESLDGVQEEIISYFINGGSLDTDELEAKFGSDIINALRNACAKAGIEFNYLLNELYTQSEGVLNFAPKVKNPNSQYDVEQNQRSDKKIAYYNSLDDETKSLVINAEITDEVKNSTLEEFKEWIDELQKEAVINIETEIEVTAPLSDIKEAYSSFEDIFDEIESGATVSADSIDGLTDKFGDINGGESLDKFREVLTTMPGDIDACKEALNQLATDYLDQSELIQNLTEDNAEYTESELEKIGVENAHEVVQSRLIQHDYSEADAKAVLVNYSNQLTDAKEKQKIASYNLENATANDIAQLINEANAAGIDTIALQSYLRQKIQSNAITISTNGDISNLTSLISAIGGTITYLQEYQKAKQTILNGGTIYGNATADHEYLKGLENLANQEIEEAFSNSMQANVNYTGAIDTSSGSGKGSDSSKEDEAESTIETFDWIEVAIKRVEEELSRLDKKASNTYDLWSNRNSALSQEIGKTKDEIALQQQAYNKYIAKANSIGLSNVYKQKVQNGTLQIEDITDDTLKEQINSYKEYYEKAIECSDAVQELKISLGELAEQKFDNFKSEYESIMSTIDGISGIIDERINQTEERGYFVSRDYYNKMINLENQNLSTLQQEYAQLQSSLEESLSNRSIKEGSEAWRDMKNEILDVEAAIEESTTSLIEFSNELRDLNWEIFDYIEDKVSNITDEAEFLIDLLSNDNLYEDSGRFNSQGESVNALHAINYNTYMQQSLDYADEIKKIESDIAKDSANKDLIERREELLDLQREAISNAEEEKNAIKSLVEEGINIHLDALSELIDEYKDAMDSAKSLYEYQKNVAEQTKNIANLEKTLMAYQGDDSEETRKIIQQTQVSLDEAKQNLKETQWDRYISETNDLLDSLYSDYEETLNARLDNVDVLISDMIDQANSNSSLVKDTIETEADNVAYDLTDSMSSILSSNGNIVSAFMESFNNSSTTLQTSIDEIKNLVYQMVLNGNTNIMTNTDITGAYNVREGWSQDSNGNWMYGQNGEALSNQWIQSNGKWYHMNSDGIMDTNSWIHNDSGSWSYVGDNGDALTGWQQLNWQGSNDWYNFDGEGTMKENQWIDDYFVGSNGKMQTSTWIGHNGMYYWVGSDGKWLNLPGWSLNYKPKDGLPIYEYAKGTRRTPNDQLAWLGEEGTELIRTKDGALLQALPQGSTVFTNERTQRLWEMSDDHTPIMDINSNLPELIKNNPSTVNNDNQISIVLPNVENYDDFKHKLLTDSNVIGFMQEVTFGQALGKNSLRKNNYK